MGSTSTATPAQHYRHCHFCGAQHTDLADHPQCPACGEICWRNPAPVAVCLTPVQDGRRTGLLLINRNLQPYGWALPGGFIEHGEQVEAAALRELWEETGLRPASPQVQVVWAQSVDGGSHVIIFCTTAPLQLADLDHFQVNEETRGVRAVFGPQELEAAGIVFPTHQRAARGWMTGVWEGAA